jgi:hypothetical protein
VKRIKLNHKMSSHVSIVHHQQHGLRHKYVQVLMVSFQLPKLVVNYYQHITVFSIRLSMVNGLSIQHGVSHHLFVTKMFGHVITIWVMLVVVSLLVSTGNPIPYLSLPCFTCLYLFIPFMSTLMTP